MDTCKPVLPMARCGDWNSAVTPPFCGVLGTIGLDCPAACSFPFAEAEMMETATVIVIPFPQAPLLLSLLYQYSFVVCGMSRILAEKVGPSFAWHTPSASLRPA